jgi:hypothetical protein
MSRYQNKRSRRINDRDESTIDNLRQCLTPKPTTNRIAACHGFGFFDRIGFVDEPHVAANHAAIAQEVKTPTAIQA